jgi:hypothetical protein
LGTANRWLAEYYYEKTESEDVMGYLVQVKLVLTDWQKDGQSIYHDPNVDVANGVFHAGSTFDGGIVVETAEQKDELRRALAEGYEPVFVMEARL